MPRSVTHALSRPSVCVAPYDALHQWPAIDPRSAEQAHPMNTRDPGPLLRDAKALVVGIAHEHAIAYGCARAFRELGVDLALTYLNDKAKPHVAPLAEALDAAVLLPLDVARPGELEAVFEHIAAEWGRLDVLVHSIAWAPKA